MKTKLISKIFFNLLAVCFFLLVILSCTSTSDESLNQETKTNTTEVEGVYKYLSPTHGQAIITKNHFMLLHGNSDSTMVTDFGTYEVSNDTVYNEVLVSSNTKRNGYEFRWAVEARKSDTLTYVLFNNDGEIVSRGKSLKVE